MIVSHPSHVQQLAYTDVVDSKDRLRTPPTYGMHEIICPPFSCLTHIAATSDRGIQRQPLTRPRLRVLYAQPRVLAIRDPSAIVFHA